jgi:hypothetical protein
MVNVTGVPPLAGGSAFEEKFRAGGAENGDDEEHKPVGLRDSG